MRRLAASLALVATLAATAAVADESQILGVIDAQIEAFKSDDFDAAFEHASPAIRRLFGTPERFAQMVRDGYPMVHRPAEIRFLEARKSGSRTLQRVLVTDSAARIHLLEYEMLELEGRYLINGVRILRGADAGA